MNIGYVKQPSGENVRNLDGCSCRAAVGQTCCLVNVGKKRNPVGVNDKLLKNHVGHIGILWQNVQIAGKIWGKVQVKQNTLEY